MTLESNSKGMLGFIDETLTRHIQDHWHVDINIFGYFLDIRYEFWNSQCEQSKPLRIWAEISPVLKMMDSLPQYCHSDWINNSFDNISIDIYSISLVEQYILTFKNWLKNYQWWCPYICRKHNLKFDFLPKWNKTIISILPDDAHVICIDI